MFNDVDFLMMMIRLKRLWWWWSPRLLWQKHDKDNYCSMMTIWWGTLLFNDWRFHDDGDVVKEISMTMTMIIWKRTWRGSLFVLTMTISWWWLKKWYNDDEKIIKDDDGDEDVVRMIVFKNNMVKRITFLLTMVER